VRTTGAELTAQATEALRDAFATVGLDARAAAEGTAQLVLEGPAGSLVVDVVAANTVDPGRLLALTADRPTDRTQHLVLVADRLIGPVPEALDELGWGYLDRRGHLRFQADGVFVNADIDPRPRQRATPTEPIAGRVAQGVALLMLMAPSSAFGTRELARALGASPSTVHDALGRLRAASLVDRGGQPLLPDLFWALADAWHVARTGVAALPTDAANPPLEMSLAQAGDRAAAHWGAPVVLRSGSTPDFYVPAADLARTVRLLGPATTEPAGTVAPAPADALVREAATRPADDGLPWVHPVVAALDLAQDRSRGQEILAEWTPPSEFTRVW
jgi:hypothetical protein